MLLNQCLAWINDEGEISVSASPQEMILLKRMIPRANAQSLRVVSLARTPQNCRDVWWFGQRFPLVDS